MRSGADVTGRRASRAAVSGFTLMELLVALFVFALLAGFAFRAVTALTAAEQDVKTQMRALSELQRAVLFWERDIRQIVDRPVQQGFDLQKAAVLLPEGSGGVLEFTRGGHPDYLEQVRSSLQRVRYEVTDDGVLLRKSWNIVDHVSDAEPLGMPLLKGVEAVSVAFLENGEWGVEMADPSVDDEGKALKKALPAAIAVTLTHARFGEIRRVVPLYPQ